MAASRLNPAKLFDGHIHFSDYSRAEGVVKQISDRDREVIVKGLLDVVGNKRNGKSRIVKQIYDLFLEEVTDNCISRIDVEVFSDTGFNKRVYLVEAHGNFKSIRDVDMIPIPLSMIPPTVIEGFRHKLGLQKFEVRKAIEGKVRPFLLKVFRDPQIMTEEELAAFVIPTKDLMEHTFKNGSILGELAKYPHVGDDVEILQNEGRTTWVTFQGLIPGLTLKEFNEDLIERKKKGEFSEEDYQNRLSSAERAAVKGYFETWNILHGLMISDPTPANIMVEGSYESSFYTVLFDIDRLTRKPISLLEFLHMLKRLYGTTTRWHVVLDAYLDMYAKNRDDTYRLIGEIYSQINQESMHIQGFPQRISQYPGLYEFVKRYSDSRLVHYKPAQSYTICNGKYVESTGPRFIST